MFSSRSRVLLLRPALLICAVALATPLLAAPGGAVPTAAPALVAADPKPNPHRAQQAVDALERVEGLLSGLGVSAAPGHADELTLELKDLALLRDALSRSDRARADQLLARPLRPARSNRACSTVVCVHWQTKRQNRTDGVRSREYVTKVLRTMTMVHKKYVAAGYREPRGDGKRGGNKKPDVYLTDVGSQGFYGYCTTDDPSVPAHGGTWAYCVLDNDYRSKQFAAHTPIENMKVTAAHEYFHNVQFAHDIGEDNWFMEATATWAEDEVFDKINDNAFYLDHGPIANPQTPLDSFTGLYHYGTWIFFRYLTDRYGSKVAGLDNLVLRMWRGASGTERAKYSLAAVKQVLAAVGTSLTEEFARFSASNRQPARFYAAEYDEVKADPDTPAYPTAPLADTFPLGPGDTDTGQATFKHLTARTYRFVPAADAGAGSMLNLNLTLGSSAQGGGAVITTKQVGQPSTSEFVSTDGAQAPASFEHGVVSWIEVTMVNASSRFRCWKGSIYSCAGDPTDNAVVQSVTGTVS